VRARRGFGTERVAEHHVDPRVDGQARDRAADVAAACAFDPRRACISAANFFRIRLIAALLGLISSLAP
jgi:hypothetical protein